MIRLKVSGPTIQTKEISVLTRDIGPFRVNHGRGSPDWGIALYYGARFTHAAAPTKPVIGVVKDKDTGKPLAGVRIASDKTAEFPVHGFNGIETTTDEHGRYRLIGLPKGRGNQCRRHPRQGTALSRRGNRDPRYAGARSGLARRRPEARNRDRRASHRQGDRRAAQGLCGVQRFSRITLTFRRTGIHRARVWGHYQTEPDGSFRVVGLPGRGLIAAMYIGGGKQYLTGLGLPKVSP